ncbi:hypothetical protein HPB49_005902 [Dermacentor silvarum]|uniref:Uncharacterized protein n=1 Tax=Dermacentor silvarum TaxID=543639 RepID=A0ACB8DAY9_DERSI|nr:hypothetical protein HPB49_005902 [Dermacentor silvarum]
MVNVKEVADRAEAIIANLPEKAQLGFNFIQNRTGIKRAYILVGVAGLFALYMIFGYFAQLLCNIVGFAIPAYASMRAIESTSKEDDTKWLTYWVVFACFSVVDFFADNILRYFPFYWLAKATVGSTIIVVAVTMRSALKDTKIIFLVYCFAPINPNGSHHIYQKFIRPVFLRNETTVNKLAADAGAGIRSALHDESVSDDDDVVVMFDSSSEEGSDDVFTDSDPEAKKAAMIRWPASANGTG